MYICVKYLIHPIKSKLESGYVPSSSSVTTQQMCAAKVCPLKAVEEKPNIRLHKTIQNR